MINRKNKLDKPLLVLSTAVMLLGCQPQLNEVDNEKTTLVKNFEDPLKVEQKTDKNISYYGTTLPFASEAVYFLMTDRFVDGDSSNNQITQGGKLPTFELPMKSDDGRIAYVGYMGGDFKGIVENAKYISDMGFTSIWLTPIVDQPDQQFSGGKQITFGSAFKDGGKTGYHGYWGVNFYKLDEHLPSNDLDFSKLTKTLRKKYQLKTVLDIVLNHGSPAFSMPKQQDKFGKIYDENWNLVADHHNLVAKLLDQTDPQQNFYNKKTEIVQLSDINENNPAVMDYFVKAYLYWIDQGADAFRIDTIKHMPHEFWKKFTDRIREKHPNYFMFAESYSFDASFIAQHTYGKNGAVSVLDFPGRESMLSTFENKDSDYGEITSYLHLDDGLYNNPYELMTFYDNHDMARINTDENGYIDAHNWLFTARGIPVIYYGSEIAFMSGTSEHQGNRNYYGVKNISLAKKNKIHQQLTIIANLRKSSIALQKGLQVNLKFDANLAVFYRVYEYQGNDQTALVFLNKGDLSIEFKVEQYLSNGIWRDGLNNTELNVKNGILNKTINPHSVAVYFLDEKNTNLNLISKLNELMIKKH